MSEDDLINQTLFDKYLIKHKLGQGSFGVVYEGINTKTSEPIAVKLVNLNLTIRNKDQTIPTY